MLRSLLAGAVPLSFALSPSQLRFISTVGMGVLVGTSLVVIIPEGIETLYNAGPAVQSHPKTASTAKVLDVRWSMVETRSFLPASHPRLDAAADESREYRAPSRAIVPRSIQRRATSQPLRARDGDASSDQPSHENVGSGQDVPEVGKEDHQGRSPHAFVGLSLLLGFILMYLIDKVPKHASISSQAYQQPHHISIENLAQGFHRVGSTRADEPGSPLDHPSVHPNRHFSTTVGLVIHAAADGIALGASSTTANSRLGLIIFLAIMIHKAPAAFGLTSVLLKQGLTKREARAHLVIFSLASPVGALTTWSLVNLAGSGGSVGGEEGTQWWTGVLLLFSAGTFL